MSRVFALFSVEQAILYLFVPEKNVFAITRANLSLKLFFPQLLSTVQSYNFFPSVEKNIGSFWRLNCTSEFKKYCHHKLSSFAASNTSIAFVIQQSTIIVSTFAFRAFKIFRFAIVIFRVRIVPSHKIFVYQKLFAKHI